MPSNDYNARAPEPTSGGLIELFKSALRSESRNFHTTMPALVKEVDYDKCLVTLQPLIKMMVDPITKREIPSSEIEKVPIIFPSAKRGAARISTPVSEGDVGLLMYCERETENFLTSDGISIQDSGVYEGLGFGGNLPQVGFLPEVFAPAAARKFLKDTLVVEFTKAISWWKANGQITHKNDNCSVVQEPTGEIRATNNVAAMDISALGDYLFTNGTNTLSMTQAGLYNYANTASTHTVTPDGTDTFTNNGGVNVTAASAGAYSVTAPQAMNLSTAGLMAITAATGLNINSAGLTAVVDPSGGLNIVSPTNITLTVTNGSTSSSITITPTGVNISGPTQSTSIN